MHSGCNFQHLISIDNIYTLFRTTLKSNYEFKGESHKYREIVFVMDGTVGISADEDIYVLEKGQAVIHNPDEFHRIWSEFETNPTILVLSFEASSFPESDGRIFSFDSSMYNKLEEMYALSQECFENEGIYVTDIKKGMENKAEYFRINMEAFLFSLITGQNHKTGSGIRSAEIYAKAVKFMEQSADAGLCIDEIAFKCSISSSYLKKLFVKYAGCSVMEYYNRLRARIACGYLSNGKSVKETALLLGFTDQNYFSTFFKRIIGVSPTAFKNRGI